LDHRAQIAGRVMPKVDYFAELALEKNDHASSNLRCWNCHYLWSLSPGFDRRLLMGTALLLQTT
jgi:hypothetical protein